LVSILNQKNSLEIRPKKNVNTNMADKLTVQFPCIAK
jgi:hypothetical protein